MQQEQIDSLIDEQNLIKPKFKHKRVEGPLGRMYTQKSKKVAKRAHFYSVTTIIDNLLCKGIGWDKWLGNSRSYEDAMNYGKERAGIGDMVHGLCSALAWGFEVDTSQGWLDNKNDVYDIPDEAKLRLTGFLDFLEEHRPKILATELPLFNPARYKNKYGEGFRYPFAGTADYFMMIDDKLWLVDIKTGKEHPKNHALQLSFYKILFDSLYGKSMDMQVDNLACLYLNSKGKYKLRKYKFEEDYCYNEYDLFIYYKSNFYGKMPTIKDKEMLPNKYKWEGIDDGTREQSEAGDSEESASNNEIKKH